MRRDDGGPVFPVPDQYTPNGTLVVHGCEGISLRDWFAGQALAALIAHYEGQDGSMDGIPASAFQYADAMLAARDGGDDAA